MTTALYRRYRPEAFGEMIGQSQVTEPLMTALRSDRVGHAYLFSGPRGCGKTTSARILARCLNCAAGPTDTPCGTCDSCVELGRGGGGSLDVVEIDAASHNGVDDARDLRERAIFAPARDRFKIFILDEAHMVTQQGFNALLKLVEEPPAHVKFIFATTEPEKVLGTIRSRTHHYPFRLVPPAAMLEYVQELCESEGVGVEAGVLPLVVRAGGGSPRDTLSLLDQLIAGSDADAAGDVLVRYERAVALLGYTHSELLDEVVDAFAANDGGGAFAAVDRVVQTGQDPRRFVDDLLERLRDLIVVAATGAGASAVLRGVPDDELERMARQATAFGVHRLSRTADLVVAALDEMTGATSPRLQLELLVARVLTHAGVSHGASPATAHDVEASRGASAAAPQLAPATGRPASPAADIAAPGGGDAVPASPRISPPTVASPGIASPGAASPSVAPPHAASPRVASPGSPSSGGASRGVASPGAGVPPVAPPAVALPTGTAPAPASPVASPAIASPVASPGVASPGVASPGVASPGVASPGGVSPVAPATPAASAPPSSPEPDDDAPPPFTDDDAPPPYDDDEPSSAPAARAPEPPIAAPDGARPTPAARSARASVAADVHPFDAAPTPEAASSTPARAGASGDDAPPVASAAGDAPVGPSGARDDAPATDDGSPLEPSAPTPPVTPAGPIELGHVRDAWPEVLAQLEVASRPSWLVVSTATVRAFDDDVLTLSFRTASDLNAFKTRTADGGPSEDLRQGIQAVLGVRVKYLARLEGDGPGGAGRGAPSRGPSAPPAAADSGSRSGPSGGMPSAPRSSAPYAAAVTEWAVAPIPSADGSTSAPSPASLASAAEPVATGAAAPVVSTALAVDDEPDDASAPSAVSAVHPGVILPPREVTPSVPAPDEVDDDDVIPPADDVEAPLPPVVVPRMAPLSGGVQRYGEAVIRQMLGATYVRDEPYEPPTRFS
ncbi:MULTISPECIES: DNA polymerase III subunit gamma and tau [Microbacterium]|uniref:DNA polymerase III subunit gamma and tau n=1 Tax=Microbacterium TaxID=33882 RepID=UPI00277F7470|nr:MULTISPECIES: DNA polymerase III subunit gamma and tau [Microbacterium]MDQ1084762.1 DNA polymerase-3 subunit gamma/tau [Microbacterium sp. SORGH_AS_0344]MDQ1169959.1 DNA polymerase-3 subunit gamma/tau [Microbacterium proteolyticum]